MTQTALETGVPVLAEGNGRGQSEANAQSPFGGDPWRQVEPDAVGNNSH